MSAPVDVADAALKTALAQALVGGAFIPTAEALALNPDGPCEPNGDETEVQTSAQLFTLDVRKVRPLMGSGMPRWVVDRTCRLELAVFGPVPAGQDDHPARLAAALNLVAAISADSPTLGGTCERFEITGQEDDDLPPNGQKVSLGFTYRLRAGDPLGRTAP